MPELFAVTGEGLARLTQDEQGWQSDLLRPDDRMQCVALDRATPPPYTSVRVAKACGKAAIEAPAGRT